MTIAADSGYFKAEYEHELEAWLRRRFRVLCIAYWAIGCVELVWYGVLVFASLQGPWALIAPNLLWMITSGLGLLVVGVYLFGRGGKLASRDELINAASQMILLLGALFLATEVILSAGLLATPAETAAQGRLIVDLAFWHLTASLFLPWKPRESLRPMIPLLLAWSAIVVIFEFQSGAIASALIVPILGWLVLVPGIAINAWRLNRHSAHFHEAKVGEHFLTMRRELTKARGIHESMFPPKFKDDSIHFDYEYTPMREIGGDFVHFHVAASGVVHLVLLDVTGHGLAAALTVNRIYGELERIRGEAPDAGPADVIALLNRYVNLTLIRHNIFATALAMMFDPYTGDLKWASAGHPPAFLRSESAGVSELPATTIVLGAVPDDEFESTQQTMSMSPGDVVVAFTDGAFEVQDRAGNQLGLSSLRELVSRRPAPNNWPSFVTSAVRRHCSGRWQDDILVIALSFQQARVESRLADCVQATT